MRFEYELKHVCSRKVEFDMDENLVVTNVVFHRGCSGNAIGIARLSENRKGTELIGLLEGTICEEKKTSCPDQFAQALKEAMVKVMNSSKS
jgi:uncharacterized protein (TIGR03905 family)